MGPTSESHIMAAAVWFATMISCSMSPCKKRNTIPDAESWYFTGAAATYM